eukprot:GABW01003278.1.p1 GENE.GABW01003278.1~~GABW01003278.1.p1  ORF type:complete len:87 (+),score=0.30 GABW01003278.1:79-339(+)
MKYITHTPHTSPITPKIYIILPNLLGIYALIIELNAACITTPECTITVKSVVITPIKKPNPNRPTKYAMISPILSFILHGVYSGLK